MGNVAALEITRRQAEERHAQVGERAASPFGSTPQSAGR